MVCQKSVTTGIAGLQRKAPHFRDGQDRRGYDELSGTAGPMYSELAQYLFPKRRARELPADETSGEIIVRWQG